MDTPAERAVAVINRADGITITIVRPDADDQALPWLRGTSAPYAGDDAALTYLGWRRVSEWRPTEHDAGDREADVERTTPAPTAPPT